MGKKDFVKEADAAMAATGEISDPRFRAAHSDPRFMRFPTAAVKTKIDKRFQKMFSDPNFGTGGPAAGRDKRGRKSVKANKTTKDDLKEFYDIEDDEDDDEDAEDKDAGDEKRKEEKKKRDDAGASTEDELLARLEKSRARMRGAVVSSSSDEDSDEDSSDGDGEDSDATDEEGEEGVIPQMLQGASGHGDDVPTCDATKRVAIVDQEWQHLRAVDLLVVLRSFCPKNGQVRRVTVYPSDFGLQRMAEEAKHGPLAAFGKTFAETQAAKKGKKNEGKKAQKADDDSELSMESDSESESDSDDVGAAKAEDPAVANERMRQYERDRMRYYYAVVEFDSVDTAHAVYKECDGLEFERSSCKLDLRYVQDDQSFDGREIRDFATDVPGDYEPPEFQAKALQHTNVKLTWDEDDPARKKAFARKLTEDKLKDEDFAAYMADSQSDDSDVEEDEEKDDRGAKKSKSKADAEEEKRRYLALLGLGGGGDANGEAGDDEDNDEDDFMKSASEGSDDEDGSEGDDDEEADEGFRRATWGGSKKSAAGDRFGNKSSRKKDGDMEVTFHAGLEEFGARMRRKKELGGRAESVFEREERLRREKREKKKAERKAGVAKAGAGSDSDDDAEPKDSGFDDPFFDGEGDADDIDWDGMGGESDDEIGEKTIPKGKKSKLANKKSSAAADDEDRFKLEKESKKQKKRRERGETDDPDAARERADLELLMMNDDEVRGSGSGAGILGVKRSSKKPSDDDGGDDGKKGRKSRKERLAEKRKSRGKAARRQESDDEDDETANGRGSGANVDTADPRFAGLFESHHFALDPTDPRYKDVKAADAIVRERDRRRRAKDAAPKRKKSDDGDVAGAGAGDAKPKAGKAKDLELSAMVAGLKRKKVATV